MAKQEKFTSFDALRKLSSNLSGNKKENGKEKMYQEYPNIGWLFYKYYYSGLKEGWININPTKAIKDATTAYYKRMHVKLLQAPYSLSETSSMFNGISNVVLELDTTYPGLIIGTGISHETGMTGEIKLGFQFDYTTGLPYIPGSSIKGMLRSMFPFSLKVKNKEDELKEEVISYRQKRFHYITTICQTLRDDSGNLLTFENGNNLKLSDKDIENLEKSIFEGMSKKNKALCVCNKDVFFDAFVVQVKNRLLGLDFITPQKDPLKSPNPIQFLKILPGVKFRFSFKLENTQLGENKCFTRQMKKLLFKRILEDIGIGAKTNVGYGQFKVAE